MDGQVSAMSVCRMSAIMGQVRLAKICHPGNPRDLWEVVETSRIDGRKAAVVVVALVMAAAVLACGGSKITKQMEKGKEHIDKALKAEEAVKTAFGAAFKKDTAAIDTIYRQMSSKLAVKSQHKQIPGLVSRLKAKLALLKKSATTAKNAIAGGKDELRIAQAEFDIAKEEKLTKAQADYLDALTETTDLSVRSLEAYGSVCASMIKLLDAYGRLADELQLMVKRSDAGYFKTRPQVQSYTREHLNPWIDSLNRLSTQLTDEIKEGTDLSEEARKAGDKAKALADKL